MYFYISLFFCFSNLNQISPTVAAKFYQKRGKKSRNRVLFLLPNGLNEKFKEV